MESSTPLGQSLQRLEVRHRIDKTESSVTVTELLDERQGTNPTDRSFISVVVKCALMPDDVSQLGGTEMAQKAIQEFTDTWTRKYRADVFAFIAARKREVAELRAGRVESMEENLATQEGNAGSNIGGGEQ